MCEKHKAGKKPEKEIDIAEADISLREVYMAAPDAEEACEYASEQDAEVYKYIHKFDR